MTDDLPAASVPETIATYLRLRGLEPSPRAARRRKRRGVIDDDKLPFAPGRDPKGLGDIVADLTRQSGWDSQLAREDLVLQWEQVAGEETARHANPVALSDGLLTVQCDSTAWAKNLQLMRAEIVTQLIRRFPDAGVQNVRFVGPDVPPGNGAPEPFQGGALAIPTVE